MKESDGGFLVPTAISMPINKWQSFKWKYFPLWLKRLFPVKTAQFEVAKILKEQLSKNITKDD